MARQDVIIIGAPRSGTNMLRDVLTRLPRVGTWPCDEINYIWRHGNVRHDSDEFSPDLARPEIIAYIQGQFENLSNSKDLDYVVEKTCANSLRIEFVDRVLADAKYIYIVRNGRDVVASAIKRWRAELDLSYILKKARYVPVTDLPYYATRYLGNRLHRLVSKDKQLSSWGPRLHEMDSIIANHSLAETCAIQWRDCVDRSDQAFEKIAAERVYKLTYETFVAEPEKELERICAFLEIPIPRNNKSNIIGCISRSSVGKGSEELGDQLSTLENLMEKTLKHHGYL